jgi:pteridine reductase
MNKTVIVTGGAKRIGKAICKTFHTKGFDIICHYNSSRKEAEALAEELNNLRKNSCKLIKFNLNEINNYKNFINELITLSGSIDVLINNASAFYATSLGESKEIDWENLHNSNLRGPYLISELLKEKLIKVSGNIINITDAMVIRGMKNYTIYSTAKGGLETLTRSLARELAPKVRVNGVAPGAILLPSDGSSNEELLLSQIPLGRLGTEQDIASAAFHLCQNTYITGQILRVDGGRSLS